MFCQSTLPVQILRHEKRGDEKLKFHVFSDTLEDILNLSVPEKHKSPARPY